ncbi:histidine kinase [Schistosoma japonicum]|nr:histidine kinase [Schistosoma japonicum]
MNNFRESVSTKLTNNNDIVNNSNYISPSLTLIHTSKTLMSNENTSLFIEKCQNATTATTINNKQDKGAKRLALFIEHFKRRAKSADPSNKAVFCNITESKNTLVTNRNMSNSNQPFIENSHNTNRNLHSMNPKTNYHNYPLHVAATVFRTNNSTSGMSVSAYETFNEIDSQHVESQIYHKPRPASFHPSSQILTHHDVHLYKNYSVSSTEKNSKQIPPYTYCRTDNPCYVESNQQSDINNNVIMYDSIYDYPPNLSPYPCPTYVPSDDITPTNENVNPFLSNTQSIKVRPTSADFYRLCKMHKSMKRLFSFNSKKEDLNEKSFNNIATVDLSKNQLKRSSFTECSQSISPVIDVNDKTDHILSSDSSDRNLKRTILRSFSCNPRSNYDHKRKAKPNILKSQDIVEDTLDISDKSIKINKKLNLGENLTHSRLPFVSLLDDKSVDKCTITCVERKAPLQMNPKCSVVKSPSVCQVSTCPNISNLSPQTIQSESTRACESRNRKYVDNFSRTTSRNPIGSARIITTPTITTTTDPVQTNVTTLPVTTSNFIMSKTLYSDSIVNHTNLNVDTTNNNNNNSNNNNNLLQPLSFYNAPINHDQKPFCLDKSDRNKAENFPLLTTCRSNQVLDNSSCRNIQVNNRGANNKTRHIISLSDYLSNKETLKFKNNTTVFNTTGSSNCSTLKMNLENFEKLDNRMSSSLYEPRIVSANDSMKLNREDTCLDLQGFTKKSINMACSEDRSKQASVSKECFDNSTLKLKLAKTKLLSNLPGPYCLQLPQEHNGIGCEYMKNDRFRKTDENEYYNNSRNLLPTLRNSCRKQTTLFHPNNQSTVHSAAVLRPPRPPQRTTSLVRDYQSSRSNGVSNIDSSYSSRSSPSRNVTISTRHDSNSQVCCTTSYGSSNPNRFSTCKPSDNMSYLISDKLSDKEVSDLNADNDTVWWSHLLPYKPSNLPSNLADRLRQRNSLILSRSSPTARLSNSSLPTSFPYHSNNTKASSNNNNSNVQNIMIQSMYEQHSESGDYSGLRCDITSLNGIQRKHVDESRLKQSRPISIHTDYSHWTNNSFFLPSLTHFKTAINPDTITYSSPSASSSSSISSFQQQQQTPTRPTSLSLTTSFTSVIPKLNNLIRTNKLCETVNLSASSSSTSCSSSTTTNPTTAQMLLQSSICNIIPEYLLKSCPPSDSPLLGQYCRLLLLRTNDDTNEDVTTSANIHIDNNIDNNNSTSTPIGYATKVTPTAETAATPV